MRLLGSRKLHLEHTTSVERRHCRGCGQVLLSGEDARKIDVIECVHQPFVGVLSWRSPILVVIVGTTGVHYIVVVVGGGLFAIVGVARRVGVAGSRPGR